MRMPRLWEVSDSARFGRFRLPLKEIPLPQDSPQLTTPLALECLECGHIDDLGRDWQAVVTTEGDLLVYCDICAAREFGD